MPQTKIVFFDIDGTLIDMQAKKITPKMLETLHRLQDRGIKICIATGRSPMVLPKIDGVAFDAYLTFNGSLCYDRKGVIFSNPIPHKDVVRFIQIAAAVDVIPASGGKGIGIEKMLAYYGLDKAEALAFGDGNNDREMLQAVGTGVAMENGSPELKAIADEICGPVYEDGIYHYCADKGLI